MATLRYWSRKCRDCDIWRSGGMVPLNVAVRDAERHHALLGHVIWIWRAAEDQGGDLRPVWQVPAPQTGDAGLW